MKRRPPSRGRESGYALLFVLVMAAIVAISLYSSAPRAIFEAQRDKEQLLIDRGQEYSRAIQLYVHKFNRFPASMDDLENTNNLRFLRRKFKDPMTGKDDWRLLHAGPGGMILDSITSAQSSNGSTQQTFIRELNMTGSDTPDATGVNIATRLRPSDQPSAGGGAGGPFSGQLNGNSGSAPGLIPGNPGYTGPVMVLPDGSIVPATSTGIPAPAGAANGTPGLPGAPGATGLLPTGVAIQQNGQNTPPLPPQLGGPPSAAATLINQILTTPRANSPVAMQGAQGIGSGTSTPGISTSSSLSNSGSQSQPIGAGLAGVASKREQDAIKTFNSHSRYNEWEFIFDVTKDPKLSKGAAGATGGTGNPGAPPVPNIPGALPLNPTGSPAQ